MRKVSKIMIFTNGNVMAFDKAGGQIPELQGFILEIGADLMRGCDEETEFSFAKWASWEEKADFSWKFAE